MCYKRNNWANEKTKGGIFTMEKCVVCIKF